MTLIETLPQVTVKKEDKGVMVTSKNKVVENPVSSRL